MNKKDRIAVVLSTPVFMWGLVLFILGGKEGALMGALTLLPLICYWGYRFIQNDISFLRVKDD